MKTLKKKTAAKTKKTAAKAKAKTKSKTKAVKKPKTAKTVKAKKQTQAKPQSVDESHEVEEQNEDANKTLEYNVETSFFYTNDKFINAIDNEQIMHDIQKHYPELTEKNADSAIKKGILHLLEDEDFVEALLNYYNITVFDLFKLLYKQFSSIFKGMYLVKIRRTIANKKYAAVVSRHRHK